MRTPKYISPTSLAKYYDDRDEYYLQYLAENRPPRFPQTKPMSIGSAFDAYVKTYLHYILFGNYGKDDEFKLQKIMKAQVEPQNYAWAVENGKYVFECYKKSGALADLMIELQAAQDNPKFEFTIQNRVGVEATFGGVPLLGKPDIFFISEGGAHVILDWKVNGYCSKSATSPKPGYVKIRDSWGPETAKASRGKDMHKDVQLMQFSGIDINIATFFEAVDVTWANQLSIYGWVLGEPIGGKTVIGIDQIVAKPRGGDQYPLLRVATHRSRVSEGYQEKLFALIKAMWTSIETGHIFTDMTKELSNERCSMLDEYHKAFAKTDDPREQWFQNATRQSREY